jgi:hypothetical protein
MLRNTDTMKSFGFHGGKKGQPCNIYRKMAVYVEELELFLLYSTVHILTQMQKGFLNGVKG